MDSKTLSCLLGFFNASVDEISIVKGFCSPPGSVGEDDNRGCDVFLKGKKETSPHAKGLVIWMRGKHKPGTFWERRCCIRDEIIFFGHCAHEYTFSKDSLEKRFRHQYMFSGKYHEPLSSDPGRIGKF
jgi:hypothetical protein